MMKKRPFQVAVLIAEMTPEEREEFARALEDACLTGTGWMRDGKRIEPLDVRELPKDTATS
jgi:hypothetical protein